MAKATENHDLDEERVIFDSETNEAHKLGDRATAVWDACNGKSSVKEIALATGLTVEDVEDACEELASANLIEMPSGLTRRRALQGGAVVGAVLVSSVVIPRAASAVSAFGPGPGFPGGPTGTSTTLSSAFDGVTLSPPFSVFEGATPLNTPFSISDGSGGSATGFKGTDNPDEPHFYLTNGNGFVTGTIDMPPNAIGLHPGNTDPVVLAIQNTTGHVGSITLMGSIENRDTTNGGGADGVHLQILDDSMGTANVSGPKATAATLGVFTSSDSFSATVHLVPINGFAYIKVDHKVNYGYETTRLILTVTEA
jgi:hypothetical protein